MCITVTLMNHVSILTGLTELILSIGFFALAYYEIRRAIHEAPEKRTWKIVFRSLVALVSVLFGIVPAAAAALSISLYTFAAGSFILICGLVWMLKALKENELR